MSDRLQGKIAIVTGGASGIGLEIAKGFGQQGARVCIADVLPAACDEAGAAREQRRIRSYPRRGATDAPWINW